MPLQVSQNVIKHQLRRYVKYLQRDPDGLSDAELISLRAEMMDNLYPGYEYVTIYFTIIWLT